MPETTPVLLISFSYMRGVPDEAELVMDARFLTNPYWEEDLRDGSGLDAEIASFISADPDLDRWLVQQVTMLSWYLPKYHAMRETYPLIAVGCTGGRHRSVFVTERLSEALREKGFAVKHTHRDINLEFRDLGIDATNP